MLSHVISRWIDDVIPGNEEAAIFQSFHMRHPPWRRELHPHRMQRGLVQGLELN
jgi:hypothetical protein